jgi:hypothetical protein
VTLHASGVRPQHFRSAEHAQLMAWKALRSAVRIRYVKVADYQARGIVHFHAVVRLDTPGDDYQPPPGRHSADLLCDAIKPGKRRLIPLAAIHAYAERLMDEAA